MIAPPMKRGPHVMTGLRRSSILHAVYLVVNSPVEFALSVVKAVVSSIRSGA